MFHLRMFKTHPGAGFLYTPGVSIVLLATEVKKGSNVSFGEFLTGESFTTVCFATCTSLLMLDAISMLFEGADEMMCDVRQCCLHRHHRRDRNHLLGAIRKNV